MLISVQTSAKLLSFLCLAILVIVAGCQPSNQELATESQPKDALVEKADTTYGQVRPRQIKGDPLVLSAAAARARSIDGTDARKRHVSKEIESAKKFDSGVETATYYSPKLKVPTLSKVKLYRDDATATGELSAVFVEPPGGDIQRVRMYFIDPAKVPDISKGFDPRQTVWITAIETPEPVDYQAFVEDIRTGGYFSDSVPKETSINGLKGMVQEPGNNVFGDLKDPRVGFVQWWDDGIEYLIYGTDGANGTPGETLMDIARSMASPQ